MANMSDYLEGAFCDHLLRGTALTSPSNIYIALFTTNATGAELEAGTLTNECSGSGYTRVTVSTSGGTSWTDPGTDGITSNTVPFTFPTATGAWGTLRYVAIMDALTTGTGNVLFWGQLAADKVINNTDTFQFNASDFVITFA